MSNTPILDKIAPVGNDMSALFKLGYGLYVITSNNGKQDNGFICNTVFQVADAPKRIAVCINKANYSHDIIKNSGKMNVNCLTTDAPFSLFERFGFQSGRNVDKFENYTAYRAKNDLLVLYSYINSFISLSVAEYIDLGSHGMFICTIDDARVINSNESMTYAYYHANVKPRPQKKDEKKQGYVCKICGYVYEGEALPEDFICPICKHPASDFEKIK